MKKKCIKNSKERHRKTLYTEASTVAAIFFVTNSVSGTLSEASVLSISRSSNNWSATYSLFSISLTQPVLQALPVETQKRLMRSWRMFPTLSWVIQEIKAATTKSHDYFTDTNDRPHRKDKTNYALSKNVSKNLKIL